MAGHSQSHWPLGDTFQGDLVALFETVQGPQVEASGVSAEMISIDDFRLILHPETGVAPMSVSIQHYGDANAVYLGFWPATERLTTTEVFKISGVTGEQLEMTDIERGSSLPSRIVAATGPLHFGTFGGVAQKYLWFFLGLSLAVITALGTMMWIERRQHGNEGKRSDRFYNGLSRLNVGICTGLAVATAGLFVHNLIYWGAESGRGLSIAWAYFGVWIASVAYAFLRSGPYQANRELIGITGGLLILAAILNQGLTELPLGRIGQHIPTLMIDLIALAVAKKLPATRPEKAKVKKAKAKAEDVPTSVTVPAE